MRGANAGLCGYIFKYNLLCEFSPLYFGKRKKRPPSPASLWHHSQQETVWISPYNPGYHHWAQFYGGEGERLIAERFKM